MRSVTGLIAKIINNNFFLSLIFLLSPSFIFLFDIIRSEILSIIFLFLFLICLDYSLRKNLSLVSQDVILFDEISLGLAPIIIKSIYQNLPKVIQKGMSAIIVEQDISKALEISDRVYCLQEGRIALFGESKQLTRQEISKAYFGV